MIKLMDFKVKSKWGVPRDTSSLERVLKMHYPGATTLAEAIEMAKSQTEANVAQIASWNESDGIYESNDEKFKYAPPYSKPRLPYSDPE